MQVDKYVRGVGLERTIDAILNGGQTKRMHTKTTLKEQTVAAHSYGVALFCHTLTSGRASAALLMNALLHDLPEFITGDLPAPAKRKLGVSDLFTSLEERLMRDLGFEVPGLEVSEQLTLKAADVLDLAFYCVRERMLGNKTLGDVYQNCENYLSEVQLAVRDADLAISLHQHRSILNTHWKIAND